MTGERNAAHTPGSAACVLITLDAGMNSESPLGCSKLSNRFTLARLDIISSSAVAVPGAAGLGAALVPAPARDAP